MPAAFTPRLRLTGPAEHFPAVNFWVIGRLPAAWDWRCH
jgi:hypothetical protein